jgi:hypothetical protein
MFLMNNGIKFNFALAGSHLSEEFTNGMKKRVLYNPDLDVP